ncbi:MAG: YceI family protein [Solirubrobacteraceae bacterium]
MSVMDGAGTPSGFPAGDWSVDAGRSSVAFALRHMTLATVKGRFRQFEGTIQTGPGPGTPRATGAVRADTIDTGDPTRDEQLRRSADFFDVERYPEISFSSSRIEYVDHRRLRVVGGLTMRGITHEIELDGQLDGTDPQADGKSRIALGLRGELSRKDFGLTWNQALDAGGALLGNKVKIALELSLTRSEAS